MNTIDAYMLVLYVLCFLGYIIHTQHQKYNPYETIADKEFKNVKERVDLIIDKAFPELGNVKFELHLIDRSNSAAKAFRKENGVICVALDLAAVKRTCPVPAKYSHQHLDFVIAHELAHVKQFVDDTLRLSFGPNKERIVRWRNTAISRFQAPRKIVKLSCQQYNHLLPWEYEANELAQRALGLIYGPNKVKYHWKQIIPAPPTKPVIINIKDYSVMPTVYQ